MRRAQAGDPDAFCRLVGLHQRRLKILALCLFRSRSDAEDFSQEVWLRAWRRIGQYREGCSFYTWVRRILINLFLNERRSRLRHPECQWAECQAEWDARQAGSGEPGIYTSVLASEVADALQELPERHRLMFLLKHREGLTYEEIAELFDCSAGTVKKTLFRTIEKLRERLGCTIAPALNKN